MISLISFTKKLERKLSLKDCEKIPLLKTAYEEYFTQNNDVGLLFSEDDSKEIIDTIELPNLPDEGLNLFFDLIQNKIDFSAIEDDIYSYLNLLIVSNYFAVENIVKKCIEYLSDDRKYRRSSNYIEYDKQDEYEDYASMVNFIRNNEISIEDVNMKIKEPTDVIIFENKVYVATTTGLIIYDCENKNTITKEGEFLKLGIYKNTVYVLEKNFFSSKIFSLACEDNKEDIIWNENPITFLFHNNFCIIGCYSAVTSKKIVIYDMEVKKTVTELNVDFIPEIIHYSNKRFFGNDGQSSKFFEKNKIFEDTRIIREKDKLNLSIDLENKILSNNRRYYDDSCITLMDKKAKKESEKECMFGGSSSIDPYTSLAISSKYKLHDYVQDWRKTKVAFVYKNKITLLTLYSPIGIMERMYSEVKNRFTNYYNSNPRAENISKIMERYYQPKNNSKTQNIVWENIEDEKEPENLFRYDRRGIVYF